ncbi:phage head morphogenesis protein [Paenibacillus barcinonensis]|uniref:phage minor head protein n=1 Tax=Paenibacillus barcinonensis TaxID=198119 RepID=UPI001C11C33E|nr:phage minor head protein [Paenibacillus barcinonensis]MBU5356135.1 phage head morphogenesis protein [Paenibacillus barcinonensis]
MCEACWELIAKADDDEFLDSLELSYVERKLLEELYKQGEDRIMEILELQGQALQDAIAELSEDALGDIGELGKVLIALHATDVFADLFETAVQEAFEPLFNLAGESELLQLDKEKVWSTKNKAAKKFVKEIRSLVPDMNQSSTDTLLRSFEKAIEEGNTPSERALLVQEISVQAAEGEDGPFSMQRAQRVSRTMSTAAANGGKLEGWKQSEIAKGKKWRSAAGTRTRKTHRKANGQVVDLDKPFKVGKSKLMYPGDPAGSPEEIINCRCAMQLVLD